MGLTWIERHDRLIATVLALLLVVLISITAVPTPASTDSIHYIQIAESGLSSSNSLAAPFAYRFGTPLVAGLISRIFPLGVLDAFTVVAFVSAWGIVLASYLLAASVGGTPWMGYTIETVAAFCFFVVKFALAVPTMVDVEGILILILAFWAVVSKRFVLGLLLSCLGIFFKEFLVLPGALIFLMKIVEYKKSHKTAPLVWAIVTLLLVALFFLIPRLTIPVSAGYGANLRWDFPSPSRTAYLENLKFILSGGSIPEKIVNIAFSLCSFWFPVLLLATPSRLKNVWRHLEGLRWVCIVHCVLVAGLALFGGTNIMVFVAYTLPMLVIVLVRFLQEGVHWAEISAMLIVTLVFNRIPWLAGGASSSVDDVTRFYGGWWTLIDSVTLNRAVEMIGFLLLFILARIFISRNPKSFDRAVHT